MLVTLFHNPTAGEEETSKEELLRLLDMAGHKVTYQSTDDEDYEGALENPADWIVVAGGDGTVGKILPRLVGRGVRVGLVPSGTANNIARTLKITEACQDTIENWKNHRTRPFRVGVAEGSWGEKKFIEAVGWGLLPRLIEEMDARKEQEDLDFDSREEELLYATRVLLEVLASFTPSSYQIKLDGEDLSGDYLLVEAMNIKSIGPNLDLAPGADPGSEKLDLVLISEKERQMLREYLQRRLAGKEGQPAFPVRQGQKLRISWKGPGAHLDDDPWEKEGSAEIKLLDPPLDILTSLEP